MINELANKLQAILDVESKTLSKDSGFVQRESKLSGDKFAKGLIFGWMANPEASLSELTRMICNFDVKISEQGLDKRFNENSCHFLKMILDKCLLNFTGINTLELGLLSKFSDVKIYDSSIISLPYELMDHWLGSGNKFGSKANSSLKISAGLSLKTGELKVSLDNGFVHDKKTKLICSEQIEKDNLYIKDLGYYSIDHFKAINSNGGYFISRLKIQSDIYSVSGEKLSLEKLMKSREILDRDVVIGKLQCHIVAFRLPKDRIAKLEKDSIRTQQPLREKKRFYSEFNIYITNVLSDVLSLEEVMILTKTRWQKVTEHFDTSDTSANAQCK